MTGLIEYFLPWGKMVLLDKTSSTFGGARFVIHSDFSHREIPAGSYFWKSSLPKNVLFLYYVVKSIIFCRTQNVVSWIILRKERSFGRRRSSRWWTYSSTMKSLLFQHLVGLGNRLSHEWWISLSRLVESSLLVTARGSIGIRCGVRMTEEAQQSTSACYMD